MSSSSKPWVRIGYCPHGKPHFVTLHGNMPITYKFIICQIHKTARCSYA